MEEVSRLTKDLPYKAVHHHFRSTHEIIGYNFYFLPANTTRYLELNLDKDWLGNLEHVLNSHKWCSGKNKIHVHM